MGGGKIQKTRKSIFQKIGHRNSSIKVRELCFFLNKLQLNLTHFKRNQTLLSLIELILWPIFSKIDLRGFRISAPPKKNCPNLKKKNCRNNLFNLSFKMSYYATL